MTGRGWAVLGIAAIAAGVPVFGIRWLAAHLPAPASMAGAAGLDAGLTIGMFALLALLAVLGMRSAALPLPGLGARGGAMIGLGAALGLAMLLAALGDAALAGGVRRVAAHGAPGLVLLGTLVVVIQAGSEELFFRGWVQGALQREWTAPIALAAAAGLFALLHLAGGTRAPMSMLNILLAGAVFGALRWRTEGLAAPIAAHVAYNWSETLLFGLDPNPGAGSYGALVDLDLVGSGLWGGSGEGLNASIGLTLALLAVLLPVCFAGRASPAASPA